MRRALLRYLCCPHCRADFEVKAKHEEEDEIIEGKLVCKKCRTSYPIVDSVPVILDGKLKDYAKTRSNWENWWQKLRKKSEIDLCDQLWVQAERNLGAEPLYRKEHFKGKVVLDAGCGNGRYIRSDFSGFGCREIIAVDLGRQVFLAKKNNQNVKNAHFLQADITNLPLKVSCIDVIASHGVLHHTPDPKKTFSRLSTHLKTGGMFALYVYHKEWAYFKSHKKSLFLDAMYANGVLVWQSIRKVTSRLPHFLLLPFVYLMAIKSSIEYSLINTRFLRPFGKLLQLIPPFAYIGVNFHERLVRNYDHYSATFNYFSSIEEVIDWFSSNGFNDLDICSVPVSIRGFKRKMKEPVRMRQFEMIDHFRFRKEWENLYRKSGL